MMNFGEIVSYLWENIISLILPQNIGICPKSFNRTETPSASEFFAHLQPFQVVLLVVGTSLTFLVWGIAALQFYYVFTLISSEQRRKNLCMLISLLPVSTICCLVGMFLPRTAVLLTSFGLLYFLMCLFVLVSLIHHLAQGRRQLAYNLTQCERNINFQSPPFCCFLWCLPRAQPTATNLRRLEYIVLQAPIVRIVVLFGQLIAVAELREQRSFAWLHFFDTASLVSLMLAIFGIHTLARVTSKELSQYGFMGIFRMIDFALLFFSAQQPLLFQNVLLRFGIIQCGPVLSPQDNARFICNFVIICEMFMLSVCSIFLVNPKRSNLFDRYQAPFGALHALQSSEDSEANMSGRSRQQRVCDGSHSHGNCHNEDCVTLTDANFAAAPRAGSDNDAATASSSHSFIPLTKANLSSDAVRWAAPREGGSLSTNQTILTNSTKID